MPGIILSLAGCFPALPPEAQRPPDPAVVVAPENHRGRAQVFALENYDRLLLFERAARKKNRSWIFDRQGIRFEEQKGEVVLVISGRYFWKFDADKKDRQLEAEELWRSLVGPFMEEIFIKEKLKLGFERVWVEVRFERESFTGKGFTEGARGEFNIKAWRPEESPLPSGAQGFVGRTQTQIDGQTVALRGKVLGED